MRMCVFYSGSHTDRFGRSQEWTPDRVRAIAQLYNAQRRQAPAVKGHPKVDDPAVGWMDGLQVVEEYPRSGVTSLWTTISDVDPEFLAEVKAGRYRDRSLAFRTDDTIRHLGFLGATPGALAELGPIEFGEGDGLVIVALSELGEMEFSAAELAAADGGSATATSTTQDTTMTPEEIQALATAIGETLKPNFEALQSAIDSLVAANGGDGTGSGSGTQLSEDTLITALKEQITTQEQRIAELSERNFEADCNSFLSGPDVCRRIRPGDRANVLATMKLLSTVGGDVQFSEGGQTKTGSALDQYKAQIRSWPVVAPELSEIGIDGEVVPNHQTRAGEIVAASNASKK